MNIIKKIINFFKRLFHMFFAKKKVVKKVQKNIVKVKNKKYLKGYGFLVEETLGGFLPLYLIVNDEEKQKLLDKTKLIESKLLEKKELLNSSVTKEINKLVKTIENEKISFYQMEVIDEKIDELLSDKTFFNNTREKIEELNKKVFDVLSNCDKSLKDKVIKEYKSLNYITIATVVLDDTIIEIDHLKDECKKHKYNKLYYEKEIEKIKKRLNNLKELRNNSEIMKEIELLRKDLYIKSKDKYDLLYNDEIFTSLNKMCDDLYNKVNKRVIDIKKDATDKEKQEDREEKKQKKKEEKELIEWQERIIKRFEDIELARKILLLRQKQREENEEENILLKVDEIYRDFVYGEKVIFNYERNKTKTELVKFYNDLNYINSKLTKKEFIFIDHINYQMEDLITTTKAKKEEIDNLLEEKYNIKTNNNENSVLANNKLDLLMEQEEKRNDVDKSKVMVKKEDNL